MRYIFYYGSDTNRINVTTIVLSKCFHKNQDNLYIPGKNRSDLFLDHLIGIEKFFYIHDVEKNCMHKYPDTINLYVDLKLSTITMGNESYLPQINYKYTAVIIEPRRHPALKFVLKNVLENLSYEWGVLLFLGNRNVCYFHEILSELTQHAHRIQYIQLNINNLSIPEYNQLLTTPNTIYPLIKTDTFLIFQTDSMIFHENKHKIDKFLQYDYVGAPWHNDVGNGGFSLRKKNKMLEIIDKVPYSNEPEDVYFSTQTIVPLHKPCIQVASEFSVEAQFHPSPFATHKAWWFPHYIHLEKLYPTIKTLRDFNSLKI